MMKYDCREHNSHNANSNTHENDNIKISTTETKENQSIALRLASDNYHVLIMPGLQLP